MTILSTLIFNTQTEGQSFIGSMTSPWSNVTQSGETPATYTTVAAEHSTRGIQFTDVSHYQNALYTNPLGGITSMCNSFYFKVTTLPGAVLYIGEIYDTTNTRIAYLRLNAASGGACTMSVTNGSTVTGGATTGTVVANTWYRVEHLVNGTVQEFKVFLGDSTTPISGMDITGVANGNSCQYAAFGVMAASTAGGAIDFDYVRVADTWTGPFGNVATGSMTFSGTASIGAAPHAAGTMTFSGVGTPAGSLLYSTELFEEGTAGSAVEGFALTGTGWTTGTGGTYVSAGYVPATFQTAAADHGSLGINFSDVSKFQNILYSHGTGVAALCVSGYFRLTTMPGAILYLLNMTDTAGTTVAKMRINVPSSGASTITLTNSSSQIGLTTGTVVANTWYRFECKLIFATLVAELKIFLGESSVPISGMDISGTYSGTNQPMGCGLGVGAASASGGAVQFDTLRVASDFPGPYIAAYTQLLRTAGGDVPVFARLITS